MTPPMMKFSFIFELLSAGIGLNMDGVVVISILLELNKNAPSSVLMAERSRAYVYNCCGATKTSVCSNLLCERETFA